MKQDSKFNSKEFKKLQEIWYKKLKASGFEDIETDDDQLRVWHSTEFMKNFNVDTFTAKESYYRLAGQFLHGHTFKNRVEKMIWDWHSQAVGVRGEGGIHSRLKAKGITVGKDRIFAIILALSKLMVTNATCRLSDD